MIRAGAYALILVLAACATAPPERPVPPAAADRDGSLAEIRRLASAGEYREIRRAGHDFIFRHPGDPAEGEVRLGAARACVALGFYDEAGSLLAPLLDPASDDRARGPAELLMAEIFHVRGRYFDEATSLLRALAGDPAPEERERSLALLGDAVALLSREQLGLLRTEYASSPGVELVLGALLSYAQAARDSAAAGEIASELEKLRTAGTAPAEQPFEGNAVVARRLSAGDEAVRFSIGLLCPLSGRYAPLGDEFLKGASIALAEARRRGVTGIEVVAADTRGSPLAARSSAERLIADANAVALVGDVLSSSTIAAAQVAQCRGTALLSPVATDDGIAMIGDWVFHMASEVEAEVAAIAAYAVDELAIRRIAFLGVDDPRSRRIGELFERDVATRGGEVAASVYYPEGYTDFRETIQTIRSSAPEALFIASDIEDLILILPQLSFYEFGVQLFGLSTWNSQRLQRMVGRDMEGALFPGHIGTQRDEERFLASAALVDARVGETNPFLIGGFVGVRAVLDAIGGSGGDRTALRDELSRLLRHRRHPFLDLAAERGIPFYTIRDERLELYAILRLRS